MYLDFLPLQMVHWLHYRKLNKNVIDLTLTVQIPRGWRTIFRRWKFKKLWHFSRFFILYHPCQVRNLFLVCVVDKTLLKFLPTHVYQVTPEGEWDKTPRNVWSFSSVSSSSDRFLSSKLVDDVIGEKPYGWVLLFGIYYKVSN